jgi:uncharacterized alkaline shock family protein YloU
MEADSKLGRVIVAPEVLLTIVRQTVLSSEGVTRLHRTWPENIGKFLGIQSVAEGMRVQIADEALIVDVHVVADPEAQMLDLGRRLQHAICRSIEDIVGLDVRAVNIHIEEVDAGLDEEPPPAADQGNPE